MLTQVQVTRWVGAYVYAWRTGRAADIGALFTRDAEYHQWPQPADWIGRAAIVQGWQENAAVQPGGRSFDWEVLLVNGDTAAIREVRVDSGLGTFLTLLVVTLDDQGRASVLRVWRNQF
ncbi:nuclear transport factor 2 family protein (plasmid) [Streptomyces sp. NBC_01136]|uniref:nuclear transport factor 2 family protein n=1 Tax=unclassified Streptomyces TaxID=2593676 RepID=UPI002F91AFAF|nr:nuclear transport factor 2 family protein [Streptomyces sp. NBC_01136]